MRILLVALSVIVFVAFLFQAHTAWALTTIIWDSCCHTFTDGAAGTGAPPITSQFTVTDANLAGNGILDKINVLVNSTSDPTGTTLTLTEQPGDAGVFVNTNLIFTNGTGQFAIGSTQTIGINKTSLNLDPNAIDTIISGPSSSDGIQVFSTTDSVTGIFLNLTETRPNTGIFTSHLKYTSGPSVNGSAISVSPGDTVSIVDLNNFDTENELVIPNPDPAFGAVPAKYLDFVGATYNGVTANMQLNLGTAPGGGGGGLIQPGLVLELLGAIGGSPYVVSPPSFGGGYYHYSDGLTLTQGDTKTTFDTSLYNQDIKKQVLVSGTPVNMTFKTFEAYNPTGIVHMGLYIIPRGQDMTTDNSIGSIVWEKGVPVEISDPNHILSNTNASSSSDGTFQYTSFTFVPTKSYDKMSFLVRAWNDHLYSTDIRVHDKIDPPAPTYDRPSWMHIYDNLHDADFAVEGAGFLKPNIFSHISTPDQVWNQNGGTVVWFYDEKDQAVALEAFDSNKNLVWVQSALLQKQTTSPTQGPDASYAGNHLNRQDTIAIASAEKVEQDRVNTTLQMLGYPVYWNHNIR